MMTSWLRRMPIVQKLRLLIAAACAAVITLVCTAFVIYEWFSYRRETVDKIEIRARIIAANATAAVAFRNPTDAQEVLAALGADADTEAAAIFDRGGEVYATYPDADAARGLRPPASTGSAHVIEGGHLIVWAPITEGSLQLGTLVLRHSLQGMVTKIRLFTVVSLGFLVISALIGFALSGWLQRLISAPILVLTNTARTVTNAKNYSIRAVKMGEDEIGTLTGDFNAMLDKIQEREAALSESETRLAAIVDSSLEGIVTINPDGIIVDINAAGETKLAITKRTAIGRPVVPLMVPRELATEHPIARLVGPVPSPDLLGRRMETQVLRTDNRQFPVELALARIVNAGSPQYVIFLRDISEQKRMEGEQRRTADRLMALNRLDRIISSNLDLGQVFDAFAREMSAFVAFDRTAFIALQPEAGEWEAVHRWRPGQGAGTPLRGPLPNSGLEWVAKQKRPLVEHDLNPIWAEAPLMEKEGLCSRALFPLVVKDQTLGVLAAASTRPAAFDRDAVEFLQALADQLALAVQNSHLFESIRQKTEELEQRVAERTQELVNTNRELEAFSYSISHDLRSPLRAIAGFSRILLDDHAERLSPEIRRYLSLIQASARRMGQLIDDLLAFSRLGKQAVKSVSCDLGRMCHDVYATLENERAGRNVDFRVGELPMVRGDPVLLRQVLVNLISNALKYTRARDPAVIEVSSRKASGEPGPVIEVRDNGVGFDMRHAAKLFGVFQRLHSQEEFEGTGVGLAIVQRVIHRHGGRIWAEAAPDAGAAFIFTLPGDPPNE